MKTIITGQDERVGKWVCERAGGTFTLEDSVAIGLEEDGKLIAGVLYDHYTGKSIAMHVAGEGKRWLNREYLWFCFNYVFEQAGASKALGLISSANEPALRFNRHLGFTHEATVKDAYKDGDLFIMTMTKDQCQWLRRVPHGKIEQPPAST